jgi:hypothetical protein
MVEYRVVQFPAHVSLERAPRVSVYAWHFCWWWCNVPPKVYGDGMERLSLVLTAYFTENAANQADPSSDVFGL